MLQTWGAVYLAAAALLVAAGVPKVRDPLPLVRALRSVSLPAGRTSVRLLAAVEVAVGLLAVLRPSRPAAVLVAAAYALFTGFVLLALRRGGVLTSCGCFGRSDTPPTRVHVAVTAAFALAAAAVAADPPASGWSDVPQLPLLVGFAALVAALAYVVLAVLPTATAAAARSGRPAAGVVPAAAGR
jgi:hypothetical protein